VGTTRPEVVNVNIVASPYLLSNRKRVVDIFFGVVGLLVLAVMFPVVAVLIKIDSRGPIFYRQARLGRNGRVFQLVKFRTMVDAAEAPGSPVFAQAADPRITRFGWFMRRTYIDEFPQWWNVIKGEMSTVGPRPERPEMRDQIVKRYPRFENRIKGKPGITGLAQVRYGYVRTMEDSKRKLSYDQLYIESASFPVDLWIMLRTIVRVVGSRGT
jgi:lipopolysaccharide/colanic/teichoic acid biosynthesis glycosyltransferase